MKNSRLWRWRWMIISLGMPLSAWAFVHVFEPSDHTRNLLAMGFGLLALALVPFVVVSTIRLNRSMKQALDAVRELQQHAEAGTLPPPPADLQARLWPEAHRRGLIDDESLDAMRRKHGDVG